MIYDFPFYVYNSMLYLSCGGRKKCGATATTKRIEFKVDRKHITQRPQDELKKRLHSNTFILWA